MLTLVKNWFSLAFRRPRLENEAISLRIAWALHILTGTYELLPLRNLNGQAANSICGRC